MKIDPYNHKERYLKWKENLNGKFLDLNKENSQILLAYLEDMENGINISNVSKKGSRSYIRLNTLKTRLVFLAKQLEERYDKSLLDITERQLHEFFTGMRNGTIKKKNGEAYRAVVDYVKIFKAFWHWYQKVNRKKGVKIIDITADLDTSKEKPE